MDPIKISQQNVFELILNQATNATGKEEAFTVSQPVWFSLHTLQRQIIKDMVQAKSLKLDIFFE